MRQFAAGESVLVLLGSKRFLMPLQPGILQHTHHGLIRHDDIIGQPPGTKIKTHIDFPVVVLRPSLYDVIMNLERISQIVYPKEIGYILMKLSVGPGSHIVEAGTGSGALTAALAHAVRPTGRVHSYDVREDMLRVATRNLTNAALIEWVELKQRDIADGFDEQDADALFLDVREPWHYLQQAWNALSEGGFFGAIVPTTNQVSDLIAGLNLAHFTDIEVCEILLRAYKPVPARLRPVDRMTAHTGYLVFARRLEKPVDPVAEAQIENTTQEAL